MNCDVLLVRALGYDDGTTTIPYGILSIDSFLRRHGFSSFVFDRHTHKGKSLRHFIELLKEKRPKLIGISAMTSQLLDAYYLIKVIRKILGNECILVCGGAHFTADTRIIEGVDHIVRSDGEYALMEVLTGKHSQYIVRSKLVDDLDTIPPFETTVLSQFIPKIPGLVFPLITARGCPYKCNFCLSIDQRPERIRCHSVDYVIDFVGRINKDFKISKFFICDDIFVLDSKRVYEFCDKIEKIYGNNLDFMCFSHSGHGNVGLYKKMKKVGFNRVSIGVEHGNNELLEYCGKKTTLEKIRKTCHEMYEAGIQINATYILGNIIETNKTITETINFAIELHEKYKTRSWFSFAQPFPGSSMAQAAEIKGTFLERDYTQWTNRQPVYLPENVDYKHLMREYYRGFKCANEKHLFKFVRLADITLPNLRKAYEYFLTVRELNRVKKTLPFYNLN